MSSDDLGNESLLELISQTRRDIHERWQTLIKDRTQRVLAAADNPATFLPLERLLLDLAQIIEQSSSPGEVRTAVEQKLGDLQGYVKNLEDQFQLQTAEVVFCLTNLRLALGAALDSFGRGSDDASVGESVSNLMSERVRRMETLLGRVAAVLADSNLQPQSVGRPQEQTLAFEYALLYERTRQLAITDSLTQLYNFGYFWDRLKEERARAERYGRLLSLVLVDIDHFKLYNDHNGHPAGNEVLRRIARILSEESREVDIVARYGGEELVILSPESNRRHAFLLAERIRQRIADTLFPYRQSQPGGGITVSSGVATYPIDADSEESLVHCADKALYAAKGAGRNRVSTFAPKQRVTLQLRPYRSVANVSLVGSFNAWDPLADPMQALPDGTFCFEIGLNPGTYQYKFVLDGHEWIADATGERQPDNYGGENSILRIRRESGN